MRAVAVLVAAAAVAVWPPELQRADDRHNKLVSRVLHRAYSFFGQERERFPLPNPFSGSRIFLPK
jgi:hypothetical protein